MTIKPHDPDRDRKWAADASCQSRDQPSLTLSSLVEQILADWLTANRYLEWEWLLEGGSSSVPDSIWATWQHHEAHRAGKKTGKWPRPQKPSTSPPIALIAPSATQLARTTEKTTPARPKSLPAASQHDAVDGNWYWQVNGCWFCHADGMTISAAEPSWVRANRLAAQQAELERHQQARDCEDAAAQARAKERTIWKQKHGGGW